MVLKAAETETGYFMRVNEMIVNIEKIGMMFTVSRLVRVVRKVLA